MNRKTGTQMNKFKNTLSSSGDKTCKGLPASDNRLSPQPELEKRAMPDRGDVSKRAARPANRKSGAAKIGFGYGKVQTVNRCSSISNVTEDCATKLPSKRHQRPSPRACASNGLCRDKCRITLEERQRLRRRYTFRLKPQPTAKEEEKVSEEDAEKIVNRLKNYYLPNEANLDAAAPLRKAPSEKLRAKAVTLTTERPPLRHTALPARLPTAKLCKMTSPVKLHSKVSIKKTKRHKAKKKALVSLRRSSSPELANSCLSPPTEIARWVPDAASVKPYYEAWVSTTLAAISQRSPNIELYRQKRDIVQRLTRNHEHSGHNSHSLLTNSRCQFHNDHDDWRLGDPLMVDERFVGRIRINR